MAEQNAAINKAETKMRALRALQPDWTRLKTLQSTIIRATEARQRDLEIEIAGKASAAGDLHDQKGAIEADLQVCYCWSSIQLRQTWRSVKAFK